MTDISGNMVNESDYAGASEAHAESICQICRGTRSSVPGNSNIINGIVVCDYCHADMMRGRPLVVVIEEY